MQVAYKITVKGQGDITALIADRLLSLEIVDRAGVKSDTLTITVDDRDQRLAIPKTGAVLEVEIGYVETGLARIGSYAVDEVELSGPLRTMHIRGNAADMNGSIKSPKERSFHGVTLGDLVRRVAADHQLEPVIARELATRKLGHVDQTESDMQLLTRICAEQGATCKVADGRVVVAKRASGKTAKSGKDMPKVKIDAGSCAGWTATVSRRNKYKSVTAYYQDTGKAKRTGVTAGSGKPQMTLKNSYADQATAKEAAQSKLDALTRGMGTVQVHGLIGDPAMGAEKIAELTGFRDGVDGDGWVVNQVTHRISAGGYVCDLELEAK